MRRNFTTRSYDLEIQVKIKNQKDMAEPTENSLVKSFLVTLLQAFSIKVLIKCKINFSLLKEGNSIILFFDKMLV